MVPEGAVESSAALQTRPGQGKHSVKVAAARLDARRGPLQHGGRGDGKTDGPLDPPRITKGSAGYRSMVRSEFVMARLVSNTAKAKALRCPPSRKVCQHRGGVTQACCSPRGGQPKPAYRE